MYVADTEGFEGFNQHGNNTTTTLYNNRTKGTTAHACLYMYSNTTPPPLDSYTY